MQINEEQEAEILSMVNKALNKLYTNDFYLINNKVHERSVVFRFCHYFQLILQENGWADYNLDMEYNKNHSNPKRTVNFKRGTYPDVIFHKRGSNDNNLLLIEFKPWWHPNNQRDIEKIKDFTNQREQYKYALGISLLLSRERRNAQVKIIQDGEVLQ